jgi:hypothetical protein
VPPRMQNVAIGQATESISAKRRGVFAMTHVAPPFVVRAMPPRYPTTRHTFTDAHAAPTTPPPSGESHSTNALHRRLSRAPQRVQEGEVRFR